MGSAEQNSGMLGKEKERTEEDSSHHHYLQTSERQRVACFGGPGGLSWHIGKPSQGKSLDAMRRGLVMVRAD